MGRSFYASSLTIPASTTWASPETLSWKLPSGIIRQWFVKGMLEHQRQVSIAIYEGGHRVFPEGEGERFYPSEHPGVFPVERAMPEGLGVLTLQGANDDDTYEHTVFVGVIIETGQQATDSQATMLAPSALFGNV